MNKRQKIVQQQFLNNEEAVIKRLHQVYTQSLKDITAKAKKLDDEIKELTEVYDEVEDEAEKAVLKSRIQSKVYQKKYQDGLKKQVSDTLDKMHEEEFKTVSDYLNKCYDEAFVGTLYDLQGQGIPLAFPIDQEAVTRAVQLDSKINKGLYTRLGEDVGVLKKKIVAQVSRGISTGMAFKQVAQQLAAYTNIGYNNAIRIARTEGHRIQCQSTMDACYNAKDRGADVVKQWDSTLDARTRDSHVKVDGEFKELDEKFSNGLMFPGDPNGGAAEVINCRCALFQRARWAVGGSFTKMNNFTKQLESFESPEAYEDFKKGFFSKENKQYMNYVQDMENKYKTKDFRKVLDKMTDREYNHYSKLLANNPMFNKKAQVKNISDLKKYSEDKLGKYGVAVDVSDAEKVIAATKENIDVLDELMSEYNSTMKAFSVSRCKEAGVGGSTIWANNKSTSIVVSPSSLKGVAEDALHLGNKKHLHSTVHEFGHAFSNYTTEDDAEFWKEIKSVRTKYRKALKDIDKAELVDHTLSATEATKAKAKIFISDYADKDAGEFLAEAFTQAKLSDNPSTYSKDVLNVVDKYFKKPLTNDGKSSIISSNNNKAVRKKYIDDVSKIKDNIDKSLPIEEQARQAFEARNAARDKARKMMTDKETLERLEREHPNKTFEELVESKMKRKGMTREEAVQDVYDTATKTNKDVNKELGLDGDD